MQNSPASKDSSSLSYPSITGGKAHGSRQDFRPLEIGKGIAAEDAEHLYNRELYVGSEDIPARGFFLRHLPDGRSLIGTSYPSRAQDAAGRSGFLEKQCVVVPKGTAFPHELSSLIASKNLDGSRWWKNHESLKPPQSQALTSPFTEVAFTPEALATALHEGKESLKAAVSAENLNTFYAQLLESSREPAILVAEKPLTAEALAALLLPLPKQFAENISILGWVPSKTMDTGKLSEHWDAIVVSPGLAQKYDLNFLSPIAREKLPEAEKMTKALLEFTPSLLMPATETATTVTEAEAEPSPAKPTAEQVEETPIPKAKQSVTAPEPLSSTTEPPPVEGPKPSLAEPPQTTIASSTVEEAETLKTGGKKALIAAGIVGVAATTYWLAKERQRNTHDAASTQQSADR